MLGGQGLLAYQDVPFEFDQKDRLVALSVADGHVVSGDAGGLRWVGVEEKRVGEPGWVCVTEGKGKPKRTLPLPRTKEAPFSTPEMMPAM